MVCNGSRQAWLHVHRRRGSHQHQVGQVPRNVLPPTPRHHPGAGQELCLPIHLTADEGLDSGSHRL